MNTDDKKFTEKQEKVVIIIAIILGLVFFAYFLLDWSSLYTRFKTKTSSSVTTSLTSSEDTTDTYSLYGAAESGDITSQSLSENNSVTSEDGYEIDSSLTSESSTYELSSTTVVEEPVIENVQEDYSLEENFSIFVNSSDDLPERVQSLHSQLSDLEGKSPSRIKSIYKNIETDLNSESMLRIKFKTGSSKLSNKDQSEIKQILRDADSNSYFLAVGFADTSGNATANEKLSSQRATAVAEMLTKHQSGRQITQAIYLGQTTRFGEQSENRVVEIWKVSK